MDNGVNLLMSPNTAVGVLMTCIILFSALFIYLLVTKPKYPEPMVYTPSKNIEHHFQFIDNWISAAKEGELKKIAKEIKRFTDWYHDDPDCGHLERTLRERLEMKWN